MVKNFIGFCFNLSVNTVFLLGTVLLLTSRAWAAAPSVEWDAAFGGSEDDRANSIQQTRDRGYIVAGSSWSSDGDVTKNHGKDDVWVVKLSESGTLVWQKSFGGSDRETAYSIQETIDGGYIIAGSSSSNDGDVSENHGDSDFWIVKLKEDGTLDWQKSLGGSGIDYAMSIQQTKGGGYILAGASKSNDGDVSGNHGDSDMWLVKLKEDGVLEWEKSLGGSNYDRASCIQQTRDGGYIAVGVSASDDGDASENHGRWDYWAIKLKEDGAIDWQKSLGGSNSDNASSVCQTRDGGYIVTGETTSEDGDVSNRGTWIVKLHENGMLDWQKSMGGSDIGNVTPICATKDGRYVAVGHNHGDYRLIKLQEDGTIDWEKRLGGSQLERARSIQQTRDGGYVVAGYSESEDGDVSRNQGRADLWIVKLEAEE
jgi:hypothetical protein